MPCPLQKRIKPAPLCVNHAHSTRLNHNLRLKKSCFTRSDAGWVKAWQVPWNVPSSEVNMPDTNVSFNVAFHGLFIYFI